MTRDRVNDALRRAEKSRLARELDEYVRRTAGARDQAVDRNRNMIPAEASRQDLTQRSR